MRIKFKKKSKKYDPFTDSIIPSRYTLRHFKHFQGPSVPMLRLHNCLTTYSTYSSTAKFMKQRRTCAASSLRIYRSVYCEFSRRWAISLGKQPFCKRYPLSRPISITQNAIRITRRRWMKCRCMYVGMKGISLEFERWSAFFDERINLENLVFQSRI